MDPYRPRIDRSGSRPGTLLLGVLAAFGPPAVAQNLLTNPGFETGTSGWTGFGSSLQRISGDAFAGSFAGRAANRTAQWAGLRANIPGQHPSGTYLLFEGAVRLDGASEDQAQAILRLVPDVGGVQSSSIGWRPGQQGEWVTLRGLREVSYSGSQPDLELVVRSRFGNEDVSVDEWSVSVYSEDPNWRTLADAGIEQYRRRDLRVTVVDVHGNPVNGVLGLQQIGHRFAFGATVEWDQVQDVGGNAQYKSVFPTMFQWATPRNALKWEACEWNRDILNWYKPDATVDFCLDNGIAIYGHNIFWANQQFVPDWAQALDNNRLQGEMQERISDLLGRYGDVIDIWDVNNEMINEFYFIDRFGPTIRDWMFFEAEANDPEAALYLNDFNVLGGGLLGGAADAYVDHALEFLDAGVPVAGLGAQCHFKDQPIIARWVRDRIDLLAEAGLPIRITEFDIERADVNERADDLEKFYRVAFSHPAINGVTLWGWWGGNHSLGAAGAVVDQDFTINAAGQRYLDLIEEWTTAFSASTGRFGTLATRGFHGTYEVSITAPGFAESLPGFELEPGEGEQEVRLVAFGACLADIDANGASDFFDVLAGLKQFDAGDMRMDLDGSGVLDAGDVEMFVELVEAGCP